MKLYVHRIALTFLLAVTLLQVAALAGTKSKRVTFLQEVKVGETLVKKGDYKVTFDEQTSELTVLDGKKVVAKTTARLEEQRNASKYRPVYRITQEKEGAAATLLSVDLGGKYAVIAAGQSAGAAPASTAQE